MKSNEVMEMKVMEKRSKKWNEHIQKIEEVKKRSICDRKEVKGNKMNGKEV